MAKLRPDDDVVLDKIAELQIAVGPGFAISFDDVAAALLWDRDRVRAALARLVVRGLISGAEPAKLGPEPAPEHVEACADEAAELEPKIIALVKACRDPDAAQSVLATVLVKLGATRGQGPSRAIGGVAIAAVQEFCPEVQNAFEAAALYCEQTTRKLREVSRGG